MTDILILGHTGVKKNHYKIKSETEEKINSIFPDIAYDNAVVFSPKWKLGEEDVFYLDLTDDPDVIEQYIINLESTGSCSTISSKYLSSIECIYVDKKVENNHYIKFQRVWGRYCFHRPFFSFTDEGDCALSSNQNIVMLNNKTDAYWNGKEKRLYFFNYSHIKKLFPGIEKFYREAQKADIEKLEKISFLDVKSDNFSNRSRQKIAIMMDEDIFANKNLETLKEYAENYGKTLPITNENKILIKSNQDLDLLYKVVNELFYTSEITKEKRETNSVTPLK